MFSKVTLEFRINPHSLTKVPPEQKEKMNTPFCINCERTYTANVNSKIADKQRYLSVISKQIHLFLDFFESCCNYGQMFVKINIKAHIQPKN